MKKINNATKQHRSFRRFINQLFSSVIKRQSNNCHRDNEKIIAMLQDLQDSIEIIARQINRWVQSGK